MLIKSNANFDCKGTCSTTLDKGQTDLNVLWKEQWEWQLYYSLFNCYNPTERKLLSWLVLVLFLVCCCSGSIVCVIEFIKTESIALTERAIRIDIWGCPAKCNFHSASQKYKKYLTFIALLTTIYFCCCSLSFPKAKPVQFVVVIVICLLIVVVCCRCWCCWCCCCCCPCWQHRQQSLLLSVLC